MKYFSWLLFNILKKYFFFIRSSFAYYIYGIQILLHSLRKESVCWGLTVFVWVIYVLVNAKLRKQKNLKEKVFI